jgi:ABC-2 type transport system ATP-binding protein
MGVGEPLRRLPLLPLLQWRPVWLGRRTMVGKAAAIEVQELHKQYRAGWWSRRIFHALNGIELRVGSGEVFGLLGPNGAGKTTLIKILLGIVRSSSGRATVMGELAGSRSARRRIGYLPENLSFPSHHTAIRAMRLAGRLHSMTERSIEDASKRLLAMVGLQGREKQPVSQYSKGMRQRLALAQALLHEPELLIMDEPTDGLDPVARSEMRQLILQLKQSGKTVFFNSHLLQEVELICDRVAILSKGRIRGVGSPAELLDQMGSSRAIQVRLEIKSIAQPFDAASIGQCKPGLEVSCQELSNGHWQIAAVADHQSDVDYLVDVIRGQNISIVSLEPNQPSLEEIFLTAVRS